MIYGLMIATLIDVCYNNQIKQRQIIIEFEGAW